MSIRQRRAKSREGKPRSPLPWVITGGVIAAFALMLALLARQPRGPGVRDHWHARYTIELCGKTLPPLLPSAGDIHTHGDGVIHIHPASAATTGRRATLGAFFRSTIVRLTDSSIAILGGESYANGDKCPDGRTGTLKVLVQRAGQGPFSPVRDFLAYLPADRDVIRIVFGP